MTRRRILWMTLAVLAVLMTAGVVTAVVWSASNSVKIRDTQLEGTPLGKKLLKSAEQIESCTTPGQSCYERGQKQSAQIVGLLTEGSSAAASAAADCASRPGIRGYTAIKACVDLTLTQNRRNP